MIESHSAENRDTINRYSSSTRRPETRAFILGLVLFRGQENDRCGSLTWEEMERGAAKRSGRERKERGWKRGWEREKRKEKEDANEDEDGRGEEERREDEERESERERNRS